MHKKFFYFLIILSCDIQAELLKIPGAVDVTFGTNGFNVIDLGGVDIGRAVGLGKKNRIVVVGASGSNFAVAQFTANGEIDTEFGTSGPGFTILLNGAFGRALVIDQQGRIIVAGNSPGNFVIARFNPDGSVDKSFGPNGTGFNSLAVGTVVTCRDIAFDSQGRIVVAGTSDSNFAVARFFPNGLVDSNFGTTGPGFTILVQGSIDAAEAIVVDAQDRPILGGNSGFAGSFALAQFTIDGAVDTNFGTNGFTTFNVGTFDNGRSLLLDSQGRILLGGYSDNRFTVLRFSQNGAIDPTFGTGGFIVHNIGGTQEGQDIVLDTQNRILLAGTQTSTAEFAIARFTPNGAIDYTFGPNKSGFNTFDLDGAVVARSAQALFIDAQGRLILAGGNDNNFAVAAFFGEDLTNCTVALREKYCPPLLPLE